MVFSLILPKQAKAREPEDEHCVLQCTYKFFTGQASRISKIKEQGREIPIENNEDFQ